MKAYLFCLPLLVAATPAAAQVLTGTVEGLYGARVSHASVMVLNEEGTVIAQRSTDGGGRFTVHLPVEGLYRVRVQADEFRTATRTYRVRENSTASARVYLEPLHASHTGTGEPPGMNPAPRQPSGGGGRGGAGGKGGSSSN